MIDFEFSVTSRLLQRQLAAAIEDKNINSSIFFNKSPYGFAGPADVIPVVAEAGGGTNRYPPSAAVAARPPKGLLEATPIFKAFFFLCVFYGKIIKYFGGETK